MYTEIDTPSVLIDTNIAKDNIKKYQTYCTDQGLNLRPHIKTHKLPYFAGLQAEARAVGITCQKISEADGNMKMIQTMVKESEALANAEEAKIYCCPITFLALVSSSV